jgi:hypothetical protein
LEEIHPEKKSFSNILTNEEIVVNGCKQKLFDIIALAYEQFMKQVLLSLILAFKLWYAYWDRD